MTTNKPEVAGFISEVGIKKLREDEYTGDWTLYAGPVRNSTTPLIRLSDYEALQAGYEKLRKHLQNLIDQTTPLEPDPGNPMCSRRIQLDEVIAERDQLRAECEKLRKDAERYRWLRDPCSGAERVVMYGRGDYGRGLMTYTMLDKAIDAAMETTK